MTELADIYNTRILELAAAIPRGEPLARPDATAQAQSKLCGSTVTVQIEMQGDTITDYAQTVKACLLGQAACAVVGREIVGTTVAEFRDVAAQMRRMLKENAPPPSGRWSDLAVLEPVRDYKARHASTLLVFDAVERAIADVAARRATSPRAGAGGL